jgi:hypothetical protein
MRRIAERRRRHMRIWTLHPSHLDAPGIVALWREALLAKAVLSNRTRGYRSHPQLARFREHPDPVAAINTYLHEIFAEAERRGYRFDSRKLRGPTTTVKIRCTRGQLRYEWTHLLGKLRLRAPADFALAQRARPKAHSLFEMTAGPVAAWEVVASSSVDPRKRPAPRRKK